MSATTPNRTTPLPAAADAASLLAALVSPATLIRTAEPMSRRTTLHVGGPADLYVEPASEADLAATARFCAAKSLPLFILGRGSNLLVRDGGIRGVVVCLAHEAFSRIELRGARIACGAGAKLKAVAVEAKRAGLSGLEFFEGIPGSVGGAMRMNAGAMGSAIFDRIESARVMDFDGTITERSAAELAPGYRSCAGLRGRIALGALFNTSPADRSEIERRMGEFSRKRWAAQPAAPSAGCIFKNPPGIPAGKLIDELGLKGARVGGAAVSAEHGNFIVNDGNATAADILELVEVIRRRVKSERGLDLETEVEVVGE